MRCYATVQLTEEQQAQFDRNYHEAQVGMGIFLFVLFVLFLVMGVIVRRST